MKVAICAIGKNENLYIKEWVEYYKGIGVDKIFLYDNNDKEDGEHFEDVISDYINDGFVELINVRGKKVWQLIAYQDCYDKHKKEYDWFGFFDIDEFITFENMSSIKDFLSDKRFSSYDMIHVNWLVYGDDGQVHYEPRDVRERFINPAQCLDFVKDYEFPENCHVKSLIRGNRDVEWANTPHTPSNPLKCCDVLGREVDSQSPIIDPYVITRCWIRHYYTKTIEEWVTNKMKRGWPDRTEEVSKSKDMIKDFFEINDATDEKKDIAYGKNDNIDIFICSHKQFEPKVKSSVYKIVYNHEISGETNGELEAIHIPSDYKLFDGLNDAFLSELYSYKWICDNYELKDYVGFCHYRRYYMFFDSVPHMNEIFSNTECIISKPVYYELNVREQYDKYHNIEDIDIVTDILNEKFNEYSNAFKRELEGNELIPCNMFIMKKDDFKEYINFIFSVLEEYVKRIGGDVKKRVEDNKDKYLKDYSPNDTIEYQLRIGGYLSERLTHAFITTKFERIMWYDVMITEDKYESEKSNKES